MMQSNGLASFIGNIFLAYCALNIVAMNIIPWHLIAGAPLSFASQGHKGMTGYAERVAERGYATTPWESSEASE